MLPSRVAGAVTRATAAAGVRVMFQKVIAGSFRSCLHTHKIPDDRWFCLRNFVL